MSLRWERSTRHQIKAMNLIGINWSTPQCSNKCGDADVQGNDVITGLMDLLECMLRAIVMQSQTRALDSCLKAVTEENGQQTCSISLHASLKFSDIFKRTSTTARRRLQKEAVDSFSNCTKLFLVVMTPIAYSLHRRPQIYHAGEWELGFGLCCRVRAMFAVHWE